ncbi:hypothetical protein GQ457_15G019130 [Hibiscus cannabinus]
MQITSLVEARRQGDQGLKHLFKYIFVAMVVYVSNGEGMPCFGASFRLFVGDLVCFGSLWRCFGRFNCCCYRKVSKPCPRFRNLGPIFQFELKGFETFDQGSETFRGDPSASLKNAFKSLILVKNLQDGIEGLPEVELS